MEKRKQFVPTADVHAYLHDKKISEEKIQETYFDTLDYMYTAQNLWLKIKNGSYELERNCPGLRPLQVVTDINQILKILDLKIQGSFTSTIIGAAIYPFSAFSTLHQKYVCDHFTLKVDLADFSDFTYAVGEIIYEEEKEKEAEHFLSGMSVDVDEMPVPAMSLYLAKCRPDHFEVLKKAGILP